MDTPRHLVELPPQRRYNFDDAALNDALAGWISIFKWAALLVGGSTVFLIAALMLYS